MKHQLLSLPSLDALRGFVAVARRMSVTLAAQDLCLTQSAVSRQVQLLEEQLGIALFKRKHRALELTTEGKQLFEMVAPWFEQLQEFIHSVKSPQKPRVVTITASNGVSALWILPRLGSFQSEYSSIDVRVIASNRILDLEMEGIDLGIRYCREVDVPNGAIWLFGEQVVPVASPTVAARAFGSRDELLKETLLEFDDRSRPWLRWADWLQAMGAPDARPKSYLHFNQYDQAIQCAIHGQGIALGRLALVYPMLQDGRLVAHKEGQFATSEYGYWLVGAGNEKRPEVELLADWIVREVRNADNSISAISSRTPTRTDMQLNEREFR